MQLDELIGEYRDDVLFCGVEALRDDFVVVHAVIRSLEADGKHHAFFLRFDGVEWQQSLIPASVVSFTLVAPNQIVALVPSGLVVRIVEDEYESLAVDPTGKWLNPLRSATEIITRNQRQFLCGMGREVFEGSVEGDWERLSAGIDVPPERFVGGFFSLDVDGTGELYAVGLGGEIWRRISGAWHEVSSPTNQKLNRIRIVGPGLARACGINGTLVEGFAMRWHALYQDVTDQTFWDLQQFETDTYLSTSRSVLAIGADGVISPIDFFAGGDVDAGFLAATENDLWVVGDSNISRLRGGAWEKIW